MTRTVLFAWELGEGLGHVSPLLAIADALVAAGRGRGMDIVPVFALCEPVFGREPVAARGWRVLPAPRMTEISDIRSRGASYADLLAIFGFGRKRELSLAVAAWDDMFAATAPDLVVADHSPTACLAARGKLPVLVTGNGYTVPPAHLPAFPSLRGNAVVTQNQQVLLDTVNAVLSERNVPPISRLPEVLAGEARAIFTLPQLDPYGALRREPVLGPHTFIAGPLPPPATPRVFFYGRSKQGNIDEVAGVLGRCGLPVSCHIRGVRSAGIHLLRAQGAEIHDEPVPLADAFARASIVISHGGGITQAAMLAGRPQIVLPNHLEAVITGARISALGTGVSIAEFDERQFADAIRRVHADASFEQHAQALARDLAGQSLPNDPPAVAAELCLGLLTGAAPG